MNKKTLAILGYIFVLGLLAVVCYSEYYFYSQYKKEASASKEWQSKYNNLIEHPEQLAKSEADLYYEKISKLTSLPSDETPKINTVLDINQLKGDDFFKNAQNGDKVLVFTNNKLAIIYRPSSGKIINSGPLIVAPDK
jgi:hypothetical protein